MQHYVVTTSAFGLVENAAIRHVIEEATKRGPAHASNTPPSLYAKLMGSQHGPRTCHRSQTTTPAMKKLQASPRFQTLFDICGEGTNVNPCVLLTQATAIIITTYEDAGAKFRDRASRMEASRHLGIAVDSVLLLPIRPRRR